MLTQEQLDSIQKSADYASLKEHPGFKLLIAAAKKILAEEWVKLLEVDPEKLRLIQGFISGANFVLEFVDERITEGQIALDEQLREKAAALEGSRLAASAQFERTNRRLRLGADLF